jgi:GNAT superfamily N-acetyltransferase
VDGQSLSVRRAAEEELGRILSIQHEAFERVARELNVDPSHLPPLRESLADLCALYTAGTAFFVAVAGDGPVGSVRAQECAGVVEFGRLVVSERYLRRGVATELMCFAEYAFPDAERFELFTGADADGALALYTGLGYRSVRTSCEGGVPLVWLEKKRVGL